MKFINKTPHDINLNNGQIFKSEGIARVTDSFSDFDENGIAIQSFNQVEGLPEQEDNVCFIVSSIVLNASNRTDIVAPATNHKDAIRNDKGHIISVPGFVKHIKHI